jgi:hypothetical protein
MRSTEVLSLVGSAIVCVLCAAPAVEEGTQAGSLRIALLPFEDHAGFQGKWNLAMDVPAMFGQCLSEAAAIRVVPMDSVEAVLHEKDLRKLKGNAHAIRLGRRVGADLVIVGKVEHFGMRRLTAGDPNLIGYKSYTSQIDLRDVQLIKVATEEVVGTFEVSRDSTEHPLGVDLFGRPRRQDREFRELFTVDFGSEHFYELPLGKLATDAFRDLSAQIIQALMERPPVDLSGERAVVLSIEDNEVYLGIGSQNRVEHGDLFPLYSGDTQIALVKVHQILGSHLCKARIVERAGQIEVGSRIGQRVSGR